jgi:hypothetical protein
VSAWTEVFLGVIAAACLAIAVVHVAVLVTAGLIARRVNRMVDRFEGELRPVFENVQAIARDAARAASVATAQVDRADRLFANLAQRVDQTLQAVTESLGTSARNGRAVVNAFRAGFRAMRDARHGARARHARTDDENPLFI